MKNVKCGICRKSYPALFEQDGTQARQCSADVRNGRLVGHYGSEIADMEVYEFTGTAPAEGTIICDACIRRGLARGTMRKSDGHPAFMADPEESEMMMKLIDSQS
tara:strand:- start:641 stop:955 length:315 start_codon:yes stop_codon:yes gene_type:complete